MAEKKLNLKQADDLENYWQESQKNHLIQELNAGRTLEQILQNHSDFKKAFKKQGILKVVKCSDGRVNNNSKINGDEKLGLAGSGILFSSQELNDFVKKNRGRIKEITSHDNCGAGAVKYAQMQKNGEVLPAGINSSDELAQWFAKKIAKLLGAKYRHIDKKEFSNPVHNERMLIVDGTAKFDPNRLSYFPSTFISAALGLGLDLNYVVSEAQILANISLGDHGFGSRFDKNNPFYLLIIVENSEQLQKVENALQDFVNSQKGRIKMLSLIVS